MLTVKELAGLMKKCRDRQKDYFAARHQGLEGHNILSECRELEKRVDVAVRDVLGDRGPGLFDNDQRETQK